MKRTLDSFSSLNEFIDRKTSFFNYLMYQTLISWPLRGFRSNGVAPTLDCSATKEAVNVILENVRCSKKLKYIIIADEFAFNDR